MLEYRMNEAQVLRKQGMKITTISERAITLMWHCPLPVYGNKGPYTSLWTMDKGPGRQEWSELCTKGTESHLAWQKGVAKIASYLRILKTAGIPVIWRPYHEMNGVWFWWCNQQGDDGFARLWKMIYERFTNIYQLDNLIWCWNANAPRDIEGDEAYDYELFYPGDDYVDILAADVYRKDCKDSHHHQLLKLANGKPIALGEVGHLPAQEILDRQTQWSWIMPWGCLMEKYHDHAEIRDFYMRKNLLSLEDLSRASLTNRNFKL